MDRSPDLAADRRGPLQARRRYLCNGAGLVVSTMLGACASSGSTGSASSASLLLDLQLIASGDVNPNEHGQAAPILVRSYDLTTREPFEAADYFSLAADDKSLLGSSCLRMEEFVLRPGERRKVRRKASPGMAYLGVTAAYRALQDSIWRASCAVPQPSSHWFDAVLPTPVFRARIELHERAAAIVVGA